MAQKSTIFKAELEISDMDRNHYENHSLTLARHSSETGERMMARLVAYILDAHENLLFTKGVSKEEEPDLWLKDRQGDIELWIELGQPDEKRVRKACGLAKEVRIYSYRGQRGEIWWREKESDFQRFSNLSVVDLPHKLLQDLARGVGRTIRLTCTVQEGQLWLDDGVKNYHLVPSRWKESDK